MTDKELIRSRFACAFSRYDQLAVTQREICRRLAGMAACVPPPARALEVGTGTGFLTRLLAERYPAAHWTLNDLSEDSRAWLEPFAASLSHDYLWGDAEAIPFPSGLGLVATASTVQWFDDLSAFLQKCARATLPGGWLLMSTFGPDNFAEIRALTGRGLEYATPGQVAQMGREAGYEIVHTEEYASRMEFSSPADVLRHIRATGVALSGGRGWTPGRLAEFERRYRSLYGTPGGGVMLTYHPVLIVARRS